MAELEILYQDADLVAVNKPSGLAVHRGWADDDAFAMTLLRDALGPVGVSGSPLGSRSERRALVRSFGRSRARDLRAFRATRGRETLLRFGAGRAARKRRRRLDHPLRADNSDVRQPAVTQVVRLEQLGRYAWVEARPRSGRLHQIRRHLKHLSCPIIVM